MNTVTTIVTGLVAVALVAAVTILAWHGVIDGQAAVGFFSGVGVGGTAVGAHVAGVRSVSRARGSNPASADTYEGS